MKNFSEIGPENKREKSKIKEGVDFVFEQHPELGQIGTKEQYSEYLDTIFPESRIKDIVYHGARHKFKEFDLDRGGFVGRNFGKGIYTTPNRYWAKEYATGDDGHVISLILDIKNPLVTCNSYKDFHGAHLHLSGNEKITGYTNNDSVVNYEYLDRDLLKKVNDFLIEYVGEKDENGLPIYQKNIRTNPTIKEIIVPEAEQAYILGSNQDVENFQNFVEHYSAPFAESARIGDSESDSKELL